MDSHNVEPICCYSEGLGNSINDVGVGLDIGKGDGGSSPIARFLGFEGCKLDIGNANRAVHIGPNKIFGLS